MRNAESMVEIFGTRVELVLGVDKRIDALGPAQRQRSIHALAGAAPKSGCLVHADIVALAEAPVAFRRTVCEYRRPVWHLRSNATAAQRFTGVFPMPLFLRQAASRPCHVRSIAVPARHMYCASRREA